MEDGGSREIRVGSGRDRPVTVCVELWGEDYMLLPGEEFRLTAWDVGPGFHFLVDWQAHDLLVWAHGECEEVVVTQAETVLPCGHNRHLRTDRSF